MNNEQNCILLIASFEWNTIFYIPIHLFSHTRPTHCCLCHTNAIFTWSKITALLTELGLFLGHSNVASFNKDAWLWMDTYAVLHWIYTFSGIKKRKEPQKHLNRTIDVQTVSMCKLYRCANSIVTVCKQLPIHQVDLVAECSQFLTTIFWSKVFLDEVETSAVTYSSLRTVWEP